MKININDVVRVTLTLEGKAHLTNYYIDLYRVMGVRMPDTPVDSILTIQLWELINIFGSMMFMTAPNMFENNTIEVLNGRD